jgi:hypothetical protein
MTRVLAELLGAEQPQFSQVLKQLELAAGRPSNDIRLSAEITQRLNTKLRELGLDPKDTTNQELYRALEERFSHDESAIRDALGIASDNTVQELLLAMQRFSVSAIDSRQSFALKSAVAKRLLKKVPPKKAMKLLGYRSLASLLKHEPASLVYAAAFASESKAWQKKFISQYEALQPRDFEMRTIEVILPQHGRWVKLAAQTVTERKQNILTFPELGTVVMLPLAHDLPGLAITNLLLVLHGVNEIVSAGSYLKLHQVTPNFGATVYALALDEPHVNTTLIGKQVPWKVLHQYYARFQEAYNPLIFEPHISPNELAWHSPERTLESLYSGISFWRDTPYTAQLKSGKRVSLNLLDVAINYCNQLEFGERIAEFARSHLWHEFMIRYLNLENVEQTLSHELQPEYALE